MASPSSAPAPSGEAPAQTGVPDGNRAGAGAIHHPLRDLYARPDDMVVRVGLALIAVQFLVRVPLALRGWFVGDDFAFIGRAAEFASITPDYLGLAYAGHVMPGSLAWVWLCTHLAPFNFVLPTLADAIVQALTAGVTLALLVVLFGRRWAVLIPFALFLFTALTVPAFVWWAAALNQGPQELAIATTLLAHVVYLRKGTYGWGFAGVAAMLAGLAFSEKTLLVSGLVFALTLAYFSSGPIRERLVGMLRRHWPVWIGYVVVGVAYLFSYVTYVPTPIAGQNPTSGGTSALFANQIFRSIIPSVFGGPWRWEPLGTNAALANPPGLAVVVCTVLAAALIVFSIARHYRAAFGWLVLLGYVLVNGTLLALSRAALVGPNLGLEFRYVTDIALVGTVCASLTILPLRAEWTERHGQHLIDRPAGQAWLQGLPTQRLREFLPPLDPPVIATTVVAAIAASSVYSSWAYTDIFGPNIGKTFIPAAAAEARQLAPGSVVSDTPVDSGVVWNMVYPYTLPSHLLRPLGIDLTVLAPGESADDLLILNRAGHFEPAGVQGLAVSAGPELNCGYRITSEPRQIRLPARTTVPWDWVVRIGYLADRPGQVTLTAADTTTTLQIHQGPGAVYALVSGSVEVLTFGGLSNGASLCTNDIRVGTAVPVQDLVKGP
ncbi:MAG: hypothetical protein ACK5MP_04115 [Nostocoides sp.]